MRLSCSSIRSLVGRIPSWADLLVLLPPVWVCAALAWRRFPMFMGDQGWYLQVALRVSQGRSLYGDVAWAYGPWPAGLLAALFRWLGPDAGWASLLNAVLASAGVVLTCIILRSLLPRGPALVITAFAAFAGPYLRGDLTYLLLHAYTQAVSWGAVAALAALASAICWQRSWRQVWLLAAGAASGMALLSKPEYGLVALGSALVVLIAGRACSRGYAGLVGICGAVLVLGMGWHVHAAGWDATWRGYTGYDQLRAGRFWGAGLGAPRYVASVYLAWAGLLAWWAARRRSRPLAGRVVAVLAGGAVLALIAPELLGESGRGALALLRSGSVDRLVLQPAALLQWIIAAPWGVLLWMLLAAGIAVRRRHAPPGWWGLWAFAVLANLRYVLTAYANGLALAPALAALWWLAAGETPGKPAAPSPQGRARRRFAFVLAGLAAASLAAQALSPGPMHQPGAILNSVLGPVVMDEASAGDIVCVASGLAGTVPADAPLFATGWGAGWYLVTGRPNAARFDVVLAGLGTGGPEAAELEQRLLANPPAAVVLPIEQWRPVPTGLGRARDAAAVKQGLPHWWAMLPRDYRESTPAGCTNWVLLVRHD